MRIPKKSIKIPIKRRKKISTNGLTVLSSTGEEVGEEKVRAKSLDREALFQKACVRSFELNYGQGKESLLPFFFAVCNEADGKKAVKWAQMGRRSGKEDLTLSIPMGGYAFLAIELKYERGDFQETQIIYQKDLSFLKHICPVKYEVVRQIEPKQQQTGKWFEQRHIAVEGNEKLWQEWNDINNRRGVANPTWYFDFVVHCYLNNKTNPYTQLFNPK